MLAMPKKLLTLLLLILPIFIIAQDTVISDSSQLKPVNSRFAGKEKLIVYQFEIDEDIFQPAERKFNSAMDEADSLNADVILMKLNTYGGAVDVADRMRTRLLNTKKLTIVYIINNAASAGALLSIACDSIYMTAEATMGAAVVVEGTGDAAGEKYQSYFRQKFRATAEKKNRDPDIAEAMVNPDVYIPGVIDSGKILTLTAREALAVDYCDGIVGSSEEALEMAGITDYELVEYTPSWIDKLVGYLTHPAVSGIFLTVIFLGIFFELQTPGVGFPLIAAIIAAILYFVPLYIDGMAEHWEILIFVAGIILLGVELFVLPGFGIAGISGIVLIITGLTLGLVGNVQFDFKPVKIGDFSQSLLIVLSAIIVTIVAVLFFGKNFFDSRFTQALIFKDTQDADQGYSVDSFRNMELAGKKGNAATPLKPSGKVEIDGERYDAYTNGEWIEKGDEVIVLRAKGISLIVQKTT